METTILKKLGLNQNEITIYLTLLREGKQKARELAKKTSLTRGLVYKALQDLENKQIIIREDNENAVSEFLPIHPNVLKGLVEQKLKNITELKQSLLVELNNFTSLYNLGNNKPGIEFYEGLEGVEKILDDSLTAKETILSFSDTVSIDENVSKINVLYVKKRLHLKISKRILLPNSPKARNSVANKENAYTLYKFLPPKNNPLYSTMQIYDGKISYITYKNGLLTSTLITDKSIYDMHKYSFNSLWEKAMSPF